MSILLVVVRDFEDSQVAEILHWVHGEKGDFTSKYRAVTSEGQRWQIFRVSHSWPITSACHAGHISPVFMLPREFNYLLLLDGVPPSLVKISSLIYLPSRASNDAGSQGHFFCQR